MRGAGYAGRTSGKQDELCGSLNPLGAEDGEPDSALLTVIGGK